MNVTLWFNLKKLSNLVALNFKFIEMEKGDWFNHQKLKII